MVSSCATYEEWYNVTNSSDAFQLAQAVNCTGGSRLVTAEWTGRIAPNVTFTVSNGTSLRIIGSAKAVIDGRDELQLFNVSSATLHLSNLSLSNGLATSGGAIEATSSNVTLVNCNLTENSATESGGAILATSTNLVLEGLSHSWGNNASDGLGGVLFARLSSVTLAGITSFENNFANRGGAIAVRSATKFTIEGGSKFIDNAATATGGALYGSASDLYVTDDDASLVFEMNTVETIFGGAMYWRSGNVDCSVNIESPCTFFNNSAPTGGAMYLSGEELEVVVKDAQFDSNTATLNGGALATHAIGAYTDEAIFQGCTFVRNTAGLEGGAAVVSAGSVTIYDSIFQGNLAGEMQRKFTSRSLMQ